MPSFAKRVLAPELLDQASAEEAQLNLENLRRLNRWTGAQAELCRSLGRRFGRHQEFQFLDIGAASGDMGASVKRSFPACVAISLDCAWEHLRHAHPPKVTADAFRLPFGDGKVDVVHCSLFLHHFNDEEVALLLKEMHRVARKTVLIQDLHRHMLAYYFLPATRWLFGWDRLMLHDGPVSVAAAWKAAELWQILKAARLEKQATIRWHFPSFRYFIAIEKD